MRDFFTGVGFFFQGVGWAGRNGRWWAFGLIPALIAFAVYVVALVFLGMYASDVAEFLTPFADSWSWRDGFRMGLGVVIFLGGLALAVITFAALTLAVGEPFYERLSGEADPLPGYQEEPWWRSVPRSIRDSLVTLLYVLMFTIPLFFLGFIPVIGQTVVPVLGAAVSGFFLTVELTSLAMERRGLARRARFALLRGNLGLALGFGVPIFLLFLVPFVAVLAMPAAVAGAALLVRHRLTPTTPGPPTPGLKGPATPGTTGLSGPATPGTKGPDGPSGPTPGPRR
ncbi:EI24 domain-containing protein [Nonomuraea sp. NPDC050328]|uniref:EI24 domain-containing protein n=1 Tax=Nonomuraea sp. NPDC050328 TaxID=3364361 RepID=UPI0037A45400